MEKHKSPLTRRDFLRYGALLTSLVLSWDAYDEMSRSASFLDPIIEPVIKTSTEILNSKTGIDIGEQFSDETKAYGAVILGLIQFGAAAYAGQIVLSEE